MCGADRHLVLSTASLPASAKPIQQSVTGSTRVYLIAGRLVTTSVQLITSFQISGGGGVFIDANDWELSQTLRTVAKLQRKSGSKVPARPV